MHESIPPPVSHVLETALYVDDVQISKAFYQRVFGFALDFEIDRLVALDVSPGQVLLLFTKQGSADLPRTAHFGDGQLHLAFAICADQIEPWRVHLTRLGIKIEDEVTWSRGGVSLYFRDPDGHCLEVASPGIWKTY
jgi:catechol 2,3-dioxygenase-like lactoylglutathione lyase family enzyme